MLGGAMAGWKRLSPVVPRAVAAALVATCCLALPAVAPAATTSSSDIAPIVGSWKSSGAVIDVTGSGSSFQGTVVSGKAGACDSGNPGTVFWEDMSGAGFNYSGKIPFVHSDDCSSAGDGPATFTLSDINHGTWSAISPGDGMTYTGSMTRVGTWPGAAGNSKPDTSCKKNGKPILCPSQKHAVHDALAESKAIAKLSSDINKAFQARRKATTPAAVIAAEDKIADLTIKTAGIITGREKITLPTVKPPDLTQQFKKLKLPTREQGEALAKKIPGKQQALVGVLADGDQLLQVNNKLLQKADSLYATDPSVASQLDAAAGYATTGVHYNQLSPADKTKAASQVESWLGEEHSVDNALRNVSESAAKFAHTVPGLQLRP